LHCCKVRKLTAFLSFDCLRNNVKLCSILYRQVRNTHKSCRLHSACKYEKYLNLVHICIGVCTSIGPLPRPSPSPSKCLQHTFISHRLQRIYPIPDRCFLCPRIAYFLREEVNQKSGTRVVCGIKRAECSKLQAMQTEEGIKSLFQEVSFLLTSRFYDLKIVCGESHSAIFHEKLARYLHTSESGSSQFITKPPLGNVYYLIVKSSCKKSKRKTFDQRH
jgi:hypothetical protein